MRAIDIIKKEHLSLNTVLHCLNQLALDLESGRMRAQDVDFELFAMILNYIEEFLDTMHHPKEDNFLFPALLKRNSEAHETIFTLQEQHKNGAVLRGKLEVLLQAVKDKHSREIDRLIEALKDYITMNREHIKLEETVVIPMAREYLSEEDWAPIDVAFNDHKDPVFGDEPRNKFRKLLSDITYMTPAPIGLGGRRR